MKTNTTETNPSVEIQNTQNTTTEGDYDEMN